jgi:hypothetical protein
MNAISVPQAVAEEILAAKQPARYLAWRTDHRGPLLIHVAKMERGKGTAESDGGLCNAVVGVVELIDCIPDNRPGADPDEMGYYWVLASPRVFVRPLRMGGKVGLFQVSDKAVAKELARAKAKGARPKTAKPKRAKARK